jgi:hypothetical protein
MTAASPGPQLFSILNSEGAILFRSRAGRAELVLDAVEVLALIPGHTLGTVRLEYPAGPRGVSVPQVIFSPEPSFSEEARRAKFRGIVVLLLVVGQDGRPYNTTSV